MERPTKQSAIFAAAMAILSAVIVLLALLQYRWTQEIGRAATMRMQDELQRSMEGFRQDLERNLGEVAFGLRPPGNIGKVANSRAYVEQLLLWLQTSPHRTLVKSIYVAEGFGTDRVRFLKLDFQSDRFEPVKWPASLMKIQKLVPPINAGPGLPPPTRAQGLRHSWPPPPQPNLWILDEGMPALISPVIETNGPGGEPGTVSLLVAVLDLQAIREQLFPALVQKQFPVSALPEFDVAVLGGGPSRAYVIYSSRPGFPAKLPPKADATMSLAGSPGTGPSAKPKFYPLQIQLPLTNGPGDDFEKWMHANEANYGLHRDDWQLIVERRRGSLEAAVARLRRRNMAISFGMLFVLTGTLAVLLVATHRARRLADLQMKFVTGVTHELRTPVSVILAASENVRDGLVHQSGRASEYGEMLHRQAKQLMILIEQVLNFAASQQSRVQFHHEPIFVQELIEDVLIDLHIDHKNVIREYEANLPLVMADAVALAQCLQNVIVNAIKYGGEQQWIRISVSHFYVGDRTELRIVVEDQGIGIGPEDIKHVFEPFYRSAHLAGSDIHGTGLGLALAKTIVEEAGGTISLESRLGEGTVVCICLPAIDEESIQAETLMTTAQDL
jgi:signal transduction histidine kinase